MRVTRRAVLQTGAAALAAPAANALGGLVRLARRALAQEREWKHGLSLFGDLKYPAGFKHFDYVNVNAPKGGVARQIAFGTFDNFNLVVAGVKGSLAAGIDLIYDTLMVSALDEVSDRIRAAGRGGQLSGRSFRPSPIGCAPTPSGTTACRSRSRT